jgi:hypothetical protein
VPYARREAEDVLAGNQEELPAHLVQWLRLLADQVDLRITLETVEDPEALKGLGVLLHATAGIPISGAAISMSSLG